MKRFNSLTWLRLGKTSRFVQFVLTILTIVGSASHLVQALEMGEDGPEVRELQQQLKTLGYFYLQPTGLFREATRDAVIRFQEDQGLSPDGIVGTETWSRLRGATSPAENSSNFNTPFLERGDQGPEVRRLQEKLAAMGFYEGPITGVYGELTEASVRAYQEAEGLIPDGLYGRQTQARLEGRPVESNSFNSNPYILELQENLQARGFYDGPLDGILGPLTREAIAKAQQRYGISADDIR